MAIWVTGAASGIGAALVALLRERGLQAIGIDRVWTDGDNEDRRTCDLSDLAAVACLAAEWSAQPPTALVNCAGVSDAAPPEMLLSVNFLAPRLLCDALFAHERPAAIVHVASGVAANWRSDAANLLDLVAQPDVALLDRAMAMITPMRPAYTISKELLCAHATALAARGNPLGIRVNAALPGPVDTPLIPQFRATMGEAALEWSRAKAGRFGTAREIACAIAFLLSDEASWISGAELQIDGGLRALATISPPTF